MFHDKLSVKHDSMSSDGPLEQQIKKAQSFGFSVKLQFLSSHLSMRGSRLIGDFPLPKDSEEASNVLDYFAGVFAGECV